MRKDRSTRLSRRSDTRLAVALGLGAFGLLALTPRPADDSLRTIAPAEAELPSCRLGSRCPDPGPAGWTARIESIIEVRSPGLPELTRRRVARAVVEESREAGIDPLLAAAIIQVESGYDVRALSDQGARGLMQLLPSTMAREAALNGIAAGDPHDPVNNVRLGVRYLRRLLDVFGREDRALMAYNAGPNRIGALLLRGKIPALFRAYPARVFAERRRLRQGFGIEPAAAVADAGHGAVVR
jgi:hypothetical protein